MSTNNLMIVMVLLSMLIVGIAALAAKTLIASIGRDTTVVQKKTAAEGQLEKNIEAAPKLVADYEKLGTKTQTLADALPNTLDLPSLIVTMENMASISGLHLKRVSPALNVAAPVVSTAKPKTDSTAAPAPVPYDFTVSTTGSFEGAFKLLRNLETSARPMRVTDANFTGSGSSLNTELTVQTYYQDEAKMPYGTEVIK